MKPDIAAMSDARLRRTVRARICSKSILGEEIGQAATSRVKLPWGLVECLVADFRTAYAPLSLDDLAGRDADALWARARANKAAAKIVRRTELPVVKHSVVTVVVGRSHYFSSRIANMPALLRDVFGDRDYPYGVAVGVPDDLQVVLHPLDDLLAFFGCFSAAEYTAFAYGESAGGISPKLYWWNGETFLTISRINKSGTVSLLEPPKFVAALTSLGENARSVAQRP